MLESAGGCENAGRKAEGVSAEDRAAARFACSLQCQEREEVLERVFEPWWDHRLKASAFPEACKKVGHQFSQAFIGAISHGQVLFKCCSLAHDACSQGQLHMGGGRSLADIQLILALVAEVAAAASLPNMYFVFNTGDQPFMDKVFWTPMPQFHWVLSEGHWTVPLPNPFHLRAHFLGKLGDNAGLASSHVPWDKKVPKIFWRGSLSAPDNHIWADIESVARVRLAKLAKQSPELFDVAVVAIDDALSEQHSQAEMKELKSKVAPLGKAVDVPAAQPRFKYILNVAAVLSSWRLSEMLSSGSVLLLQEDSTSELIYQWLEPWEHYVPVSASLSDLVPKVRWLEAHPERAEAIARAGFARFQARVRRQDTLCYVWQLLRTLANVSTPHEVPDPSVLLERGWQEVDLQKLAWAAPSHVRLQDMLKAARATEL